jgi:hypothetical protein
MEKTFKLQILNDYVPIMHKFLGYTSLFHSQECELQKIMRSYNSEGTVLTCTVHAVNMWCICAL